MGRYLNRWTALCAWAVLMAIVWPMFVPNGMSIGTFILLTLTGPLVLIAAAAVWGAHRPTPSVGQTRVEAEAAGLAALRSSAVGRQRIAAALAAIDTALARGENATAEDIAFHGAVAQATGNPQFSRFLEYIGHFVIPRQSGGVAGGPGRRDSRCLFQVEHRAIAAAIQARDAAAARDAMRRHLANSQARYRHLMAEAGGSPEGRRRR